MRRDSEEFKRWKASQGGEVSANEVAALTLKDKHGNEIEKQLPGGKKKVKTKPQVIVHVSRHFSGHFSAWCQCCYSHDTACIPQMPQQLTTEPQSVGACRCRACTADAKIELPVLISIPHQMMRTEL